MNKNIEKIYYKSPYLFQNAFISLYGFYLHRMRYGGRSQEYTNELLESQWFSKEALWNLQRERLKKTISHAFNTVPYYYELFKKKGIMPKKIKDIPDLGKIPFLTKDIIKENHEKLISNAGKRLIKLHTSGTTGSPLTIVCGTDDRRRHYAFLNRFRLWHGIKLGMPRASFFGRILIHPEQKEPPYWRFDLTENNCHFSSYHMSEKNLWHYYRKLAELRPVEISGYPSSLFALGRYIVQEKLPPLAPRFMMTTAETLLEHQRDIIEKAFNCRVSDQYGCTEMALFAAQCEKGNYHINPEYSLVEVINKNGLPIEGNGEGEVVCTSFINTVMPLIRYRLGDLIRLSSSSCGCGRNFQIVDQITGRADDVLITPDGNPLGRLDPIFKSLTGIYETQIIQNAEDSLELKMVTKTNFGKNDIEGLIYEMRKRTGQNMKIKINIVKEIPKDKNGKFKSVISKIGKKEFCC